MLSQMQAKIRQLSPVGSPKNQNKLIQMADTSLEYASSEDETASNYKRSYTAEAKRRELYQSQRGGSPQGFYNQLAMTQKAQRESQSQLALETMLGVPMTPPRPRQQLINPPKKKSRPPRAVPVATKLPSPRPVMLPPAPPTPPAVDVSMRAMDQDEYLAVDPNDPAALRAGRNGHAGHRPATEIQYGRSEPQRFRHEGDHGGYLAVDPNDPAALRKLEKERDLFVQKLLNGELDPRGSPS